MVEQFKKNRAAKHIQNQWIKHRHDVYEQELDDVGSHRCISF